MGSNFDYSSINFNLKWEFFVYFWILDNLKPFKLYSHWEKLIHSFFLFKTMCSNLFKNLFKKNVNNYDFV